LCRHDCKPIMPKRRLGELRELRQRLAFAERLLTGVAEANNSLLNIRDYRESIQTSLEILGRSTQVDRVYIFQCHDDPSSGAHLSSQKWEWVAEGIEPEIDNPALQNLSFDDFLPRWYHELSRGNEMAGLVKDFPALERSILEPQSILSIVIVPIAVRDVFWGYMGFDDCHRGHDWMPSEIAALKTVANSFGGAFARRSAEAALQQVNESLEMRIQQRTAELEASMKLAKQASQAKTDFLANMSHELRTPLNGILGYAQIMQCSPALPAKERANISTIEQCGRHLLTLINDVLDHAKIESKKMDLFSTDVHFSSFIQAIVEMLDIQAKKKGISLSYEPSPREHIIR
jgi:two-component system, sensor histidine kinase and response regulator